MNLYPGIGYADETNIVPISNAGMIPIVKDPDLIIRVKQDETVVLEKKVNLDELNGMTLTQQIYTSLDGDETPQLIAAEGIPLTELLKMLNVKLEDVQSFHIYSSEGWHRSFTKKFLFDVPRYMYPEILPAQEQGQQSLPEQALKIEAAPKDGANPADDQASGEINKIALPEQQPVSVQPMLTLRCYEELMGAAADWGKLNNSYGIRICYGQMNPGDVCSTLFGSHINQLEINIKTSQKDENENGYIATLIGGSDDAASDEVPAIVTDASSGKQIDNVPSTLTIKAGYYGQEYTELKTFTLAELKSLPQIKQAYTLIDKNASVIVETAVGVRLVDLLAAAGIDANSVQALHFYSKVTEKDTAVSYKRVYLLGTPRYFYPRLPSCWDGGPTAGAAKGAVRVDTIIALKDYWRQSTKAPDFYNVNGNNRFRLVFGQANTTAETASRSLQWIHTIEVQISGAPAEGNGKLISSGQSGDGSSDAQKNSQEQAEKIDTGEAMQKVEVSTSTSQGDGYSKKTIYTLSPAKAVPMAEPVHHYELIGLFSLCIFTIGATIQYFGYRREIQLLYGKVYGNLVSAGNAIIQGRND